MRKKTDVLIGIILLVLILTPALLQAEEIKVPFGAIKSNCYGKIDMSKAEFDLSEVGKECVVESWLKENLDEEKTKDADEQKLDKESRIKLQGEKNAANFSWSGLLFANEEKEVKITVRDERFVHNIEINPTVTFLVFHDDPSGWGKVIQEPGKHKFTGPGGYVEKVELPVEKKGEEWTGRIKLLPQKSIRQIALWGSSSGGPQNKHVTLLVQIFKQKELEILKLAKKDPSLKEVVEFIDTPEELSTFMNNYFSIKFHEGHTAYSPRRFLQLKKGNCKDWAVFAGYILKENGYKAKQLAYSPEAYKGSHLIAVYWMDNKIYHISTLLVNAAIFGPFNSIEELLQNEVERSTDISQKIICYVLAPPTKLTVEKHCLFAEPE